MKNVKLNVITAYILLLGLLLIMMGINISTGSVKTSIGEVYDILFKGLGDPLTSRIVWDIRFPRLLAAIILGGALSVSGLLLQVFFQNPIAGPYVLGISSGAKLTVAITMIIFMNRGVAISSLFMVLAAFIGSIIATGFVLIISFKTRNMSRLIICGILIGYICSAITDFCVTFASDSNIVNLHNWSLGSLSGMTWNNITVMALIVFATITVTFMLSKPISAYQLGETYARSMGVNVLVLRIGIILLSSILSACVTAFAGPISFVGIAVPHLVKSISKTSKPIVLIPGCFLGGAVITLICDGIARTVFAPTELSISSVTAILLVPVVIFMMLGKRGGTNE